ncbi:MAG: amino acid decarboxylase [Lachnospiraceae bacterium]|nr:amino acid decarboxylase [Lachnospiraceae bacterium]
MGAFDRKNIGTPIGDFIDDYVNNDGTRLHMPGHKGSFGNERDITEICGADSLYFADGIIKKSEETASGLFGSRATFFGTEGSSQIIKAMCFLALAHYRKKGGTAEHPVIIAGRNAHRAFISASMLLGFKIGWIGHEGKGYSLCECKVTADDITEHLRKYSETGEISNVAGVYVTSPDYLGNMADIEGLAEAVHEAGLLLLCDNAHGSYLRFMEKDLHPLSLGADMVSDSAHKTLPVLTGGAYMHISKNAPELLEKEAKRSMLLFGSTSPSYLTLESLDKANALLSPAFFADTVNEVKNIKSSLVRMGYDLYGDEPLKIVIDMRKSGVSGNQFHERLREKNIECEYADPDFLVTMWSPCNSFPGDKERFLAVCEECVADYSVKNEHPSELTFRFPKVIKQPYELVFCAHRPMRRDDLDSGKVCVVSDALIACPPAISPIVCGEMPDENTLKILDYYGLPMPEIVE